MSKLLEKEEKPREDPTPLNSDCNCEGQTLSWPPKRSQCLPCIESWVRAVGYERALAEAEIRPPVCGGRILQMANQLHRARRLTPED